MIGNSKTAAGAGDTELARYNTSVQYRLAVAPFRFGTIYQLGGYDQGNGTAPSTPRSAAISAASRSS